MNAENDICDAIFMSAQLLEKTIEGKDVDLKPLVKAINSVASSVNHLAISLGSNQGSNQDSVAVWESLYQIAKIKTSESN